ncbi:type IV conjugative transfer system protein TraL [Candidatus Skiveiella danica]|uniref:type IV conjugative transfer system protein TraL n=1 Tax=Candidatus Skiveiella danica TaxID=3386177 RepID=UPI0009CF62FC|nr:MAG: TraL protein [Alphaproteobacteria bacterium ADurb.Bin100]
MNDASLDIPRRLNDAPRMFWWEIDVALIFLGAVLAGLLAGFFMTGCALGVLLALSFAKAKSGEHPAFALHLLYWHLPSIISGLRRTPPSYQRELMG